MGALAVPPGAAHGKGHGVRGLVADDGVEAKAGAAEVFVVVEQAEAVELCDLGIFILAPLAQGAQGCGSCC
jgi:hypothetical protein